MCTFVNESECFTLSYGCLTIKIPIEIKNVIFLMM